MTPAEGLAYVGQLRPVSRETQVRLIQLHDLLLQWQSRHNLISPKTLDDIWNRHIADSVQMHSATCSAGRLVDLGSGAGFPGLVIAILLAENHHGSIHLIESNAKKCAFLNAVIRSTQLKSLGVDIVVHNERIENCLPKLELADSITARALAPLNDLLELSKTQLVRGATGIFAKGRNHSEEMQKARRSWIFDCETIPSALDAGSVILKISGLRPR